MTCQIGSIVSHFDKKIIKFSLTIVNVVRKIRCFSYWMHFEVDSMSVSLSISQHLSIGAFMNYFTQENNSLYNTWIKLTKLRWVRRKNAYYSTPHLIRCSYLLTSFVSRNSPSKLYALLYFATLYSMFSGPYKN